MKKISIAVLAVALTLIISSCSDYVSSNEKQENIDMNNIKGLGKAIFAGGCFWCMEPPFEKKDGVLEVSAGYTGGHVKDPTYEQVSSGTTGHYEAIQIVYNPAKVSYEELLDIFWKQVDPTDDGGAFVDRGSQYKTAIFYSNEKEKRIAELSKEKIASMFDKPIATKILKLDIFYKAENYHQDYYKNNPLRYQLYKEGSGREETLKEVWKEESKSGVVNKMPEDKSSEKSSLFGAVKESSPAVSFKKPSADELKNKLTPLQYSVTQSCGTERAFDNEFWDDHREGIYVDIVSGEPLFSSKDKFDSGTGWPSFTKPIEQDNIIEKEDKSLFMSRTEVRSKNADSHLGHLFPDGPAPTGQRYCVNSASLRFIPKDDLEKEGYGKYKKLFE